MKIMGEIKEKLQMTLTAEQVLWDEMQGAGNSEVIKIPDASQERLEQVLKFLDTHSLMQAASE